MYIRDFAVWIPFTIFCALLLSSMLVGFYMGWNRAMYWCGVNWLCLLIAWIAGMFVVPMITNMLVKLLASSSPDELSVNSHIIVLSLSSTDPSPIPFDINELKPVMNAVLGLVFYLIVALVLNLVVFLPFYFCCYRYWAGIKIKKPSKKRAKLMSLKRKSIDSLKKKVTVTVTVPQKISRMNRAMSSFSGLVLAAFGSFPITFTLSNVSQIALISTATANMSESKRFSGINSDLMKFGSLISFWDKDMEGDSLKTTADSLLSIVYLFFTKEPVLDAPPDTDASQSILAGFFQTLTECIYFNADDSDPVAAYSQYVLYLSKDWNDHYASYPSDENSDGHRADFESAFYAKFAIKLLLTTLENELEQSVPDDGITKENFIKGSTILSFIQNDSIAPPLGYDDEMLHALQLVPLPHIIIKRIPVRNELFSGFAEKLGAGFGDEEGSLMTPWSAEDRVKCSEWLTGRFFAPGLTENQIGIGL